MENGVNASWLISSVFSTAAFCAVYIVAQKTLGEEGLGVWDWVAAEILRGISQLLWIYASMGGQSLLLPDDARAAATAADLLAVLFQWRSLRKLSHASAPGRWTILTYAALIPGGWLAFAFSSSSGSPDRVSEIGMLCSSAAVALPLLPAARLARKFWGARLLALVFGSMLMITVWPMLFDAVDWRRAFFELATLVEPALGILLSAGFLILLQERVREQILKASVTDQLTGVFNRHGLLPVLEREFHASKRANRPVSMAILDLDHFKKVNDSFGHGVGDLVLKRFAACVLGQIRKGDAIGRWGGEEFLLLLPDQNLQQAKATAERIRASIGSGALQEGLPPVTVSIGVAMAQDAQSVDAWVSMADALLYKAKHQRNCVMA